MIQLKGSVGFSGGEKMKLERGKLSSEVLANSIGGWEDHQRMRIALKDGDDSKEQQSDDLPGCFLFLPIRPPPWLTWPLNFLDFLNLVGCVGSSWSVHFDGDSIVCRIRCWPESTQTVDRWDYPLWSVQVERESECKQEISSQIPIQFQITKQLHTVPAQGQTIFLPFWVDWNH